MLTLFNARWENDNDSKNSRGLWILRRKRYGLLILSYPDSMDIRAPASSTRIYTSR